MTKADRILAEARKLGFSGFGGSCGNAAIAINKVIFNGKGKYVAAFNEYLYSKGRWTGHIAVEYGKKLYDAEGVLGFGELQDFAMLDADDPDYGLPNEKAAETVGLFEISEEEIDEHFGEACPIQDMEKMLRQAKKEVEKK